MQTIIAGWMAQHHWNCGNMEYLDDLFLAWPFLFFVSVLARSRKRP